MRDIKFSCMWTDGESWIEQRHTLDEIENGMHWERMSDMPLLRHFTLVRRRQFTGLKDKDGVEIYEGDIVTGEYHNFSVDYSKFGSVEMGYTQDSDGWSCRETYGWVTTNGSSLSDLDECKVIGNIYANPELLEYPE